LIPINNARTRGATGWCLEVHDLVISKYAANSEKDRIFVRAAIRHGLVEREPLQQRLAQTELQPELRALIVGLFDRDFCEAGRGG
jgi:hypothetical protein